MQYIIESKKRFLTMLACIIMASSNLFCRHEEFVVVGGGMAGAMEAYQAFCDAKKKNQPLRVTILEQNKSIIDTTVCHIVPSFTPDEILSVVPRGQELVKKLQILFSEPGGIRVDDVQGIQNSIPTNKFQEQVQKYSLDEIGHNQRTKHLLELGKMSMDMWKEFYETADAELKEILRSSNFNACYEPAAINNNKCLRNGYRIDLIYNVSNAQERALSMKKDYETLGYKQCTLLSPAEVMALDPFLTDFCNAHSVNNANGKLEWRNDSVAIWRPGGCFDAQAFLPKFYSYLTKLMGTYTNADGKIENCFNIKFDAKVTGLEFGRNKKGEAIIAKLYCANGETINLVDQDNVANCVFCPGESVGTMKKLGLHEPAYAGFAGASLMLTIDIPEDKLQSCVAFNHCMEVHQEGVVLAWQARFRDNKIFIGVAGTKAFYSDQKPTKNQEFAKNRNLLQLNMINDVLPEFISWALNRDTKGQILTEDDLYKLEDKGIATRWAGTRAVVYDGFPSLGYVYTENNKVVNARCTTHLGSGGASFAPAAVAISRSALETKDNADSFVQTILHYGNSTRTA